MKILVEVITPGNGKTYELMLDDKLTVGAAKEKIIEEIQAFENGCIEFDENVAIYSTSSRAHLHDNRNLHKTGLRSGQTVFLL
jgi:hypothetical protein